VSIITQQLWFRRNKVVFGGTVMNSTALVKCAQDTLEAFHQATVVANPFSPAPVNHGVLYAVAKTTSWPVKAQLGRRSGSPK
jgi:hypothetical protein